ncbi:MAG: FAD-dependent thymidylate synthase [Thermoguttaceae bacterium]|nr:FAD-dependent thymidylate synthase [Thermoguttaceae bacterium]
MEYFTQKNIDVNGENCFVMLVESQGSDASPWRAARVCRGAGFNPEIPERDVLTQKLAALWKARHCRCFEHARLVFGIRAPLWVVDQFRTYRCAGTSFSHRSCDPIELRDKQFPDELSEPYLAKVASLLRYQAYRNKGASREEARRVLTQEILTEYLPPWDLRQFFHLCNERLHPAAHSTTRRFAEAMLELAEPAFPCAVAAYKEARNDARD